MNTQHLSRLPLFAAITTLVWAADAHAAPSVSIDVVPDTPPGMSCLQVGHPCAEPESASMYVDGTLVWSIGGPGIVPQSEGGLLEAPCLDEFRFGAGAHTVDVVATCDGSTDADSIDLTFEDPGVELFSVSQPRQVWSKGQTVVLDLVARRPGLVVTADFSAVDSSFLPGQEQVEDLGEGRYRVSYTLSEDNDVDGGAHTVAITVADAAGPARTYWDAATVRYSPRKPGRVEVGGPSGASFQLGELPDAGLDATLLPLRPTFHVLQKGPERAVIRGLVWSWDRLEGSDMVANLRERGTGGYSSAVVPVTWSHCLWQDHWCVSAVRVPVGVRAGSVEDAAGQAVELELSLSANVDGIPDHGPAIPMPDPWYVPPQPADEFGVSGLVTYGRVRQIGSSSPNDSRSPQYGTLSKVEETWPVPYARVEIRDRCGHTYVTYTRSDGVFHRYVPDECDDPEYVAELVSTANWSPVNVEVVDPDSEDPERLPLEWFTPQAGTHTHLAPLHMSSEHPFYGSFAVLALGVRFQQWLKPYLVGTKKTQSLPLLTYAYRWNWCPVKDPQQDAPTSQYSNKRVEVCSARIEGDYKGINPDEEDEHALAHESSHWYQDHFTPGLWGNGEKDPAFFPAGTFGEGFADTLSTIFRQDLWVHKDTGWVSEAESPEFQGTYRRAGGSSSYTAFLPTDLYVVDFSFGSGGWDRRILWDVFDGAAAEPLGVFARTQDEDQVNPPMTDYGTAFDTFGGAEVFRDVLVHYLGGKFIPGNLPNDPSPQNLYHYSNVGSKGVDVTDFLYGVRCRAGVEPAALNELVRTVMDYRNFVAEDAPTTCP